jgi:hypothetical protein
MRQILMRLWIQPAFDWVGCERQQEGGESPVLIIFVHGKDLKGTHLRSLASAEKLVRAQL